MAEQPVSIKLYFPFISFHEDIPCSSTETLYDAIKRSEQQQELKLNRYGEYALYLLKDENDIGKWLRNWNVKIEDLHLTNESKILCIKKLRSIKFIIPGDDEEYEVVIDETKSVKEITSVFGEKLEIRQDLISDFSLRDSTKSEKEWFQHDLTLREQGFNFENKILFDKYHFNMDEEINASDSKALTISYLKAKTKYLEGNLNCEKDEIITMTALLVAIDKEEIQNLLPKNFGMNVDEEVKKEVERLQSQQSEQHDLRVDFILECAKKDLYSYTLFHVKDSATKEFIILGVNDEEIILLHRDFKYISSISYKNLLRWKLQKNSIIFYLRGRDAKIFKSEEAEHIARLIASYQTTTNPKELSTTEPEDSIRELLLHEDIIREAKTANRLLEKQLFDQSFKKPLPEFNKINIQPNSDPLTKQHMDILSQIIQVEVKSRLQVLEQRLHSSRLQAFKLGLYETIADEIESQINGLSTENEVKFKLREQLEKMKEYEDYVNFAYRCAGKRHKEILDKEIELGKQKGDLMNKQQEWEMNMIEKQKSMLAEKDSKKRSTVLFGLSFGKKKKEESKSKLKHTPLQADSRKNSLKNMNQIPKPILNPIPKPVVGSPNSPKHSNRIFAGTLITKLTKSNTNNHK